MRLEIDVVGTATARQFKPRKPTGRVGQSAEEDLPGEHVVAGIGVDAVVVEMDVSCACAEVVPDGAGPPPAPALYSRSPKICATYEPCVGMIDAKKSS